MTARRRARTRVTFSVTAPPLTALAVADAARNLPGFAATRTRAIVRHPQDCSLGTRANPGPLEIELERLPAYP